MYDKEKMTELNIFSYIWKWNITSSHRTETLLEKTDDTSAEDCSTEQSHLLSSTRTQGPTSDTDEDLENQQERVHLLEMAEPEATPTEATALTHDTRV